MTDLIDVPAVIRPAAERVSAPPEPSSPDPRYVEKALLGAVGIASIAWLALIGWFLWWLVT